MTTQPIVESGMTFGPYADGQCFYIEQSTTYAGVEQYTLAQLRYKFGDR